MKILGHRGIRQDENFDKPYQNTIDAIEYSFSQKVDGIEIDLWASKDGICYVIHDDELNLHGAENLKITELNSEEISKIKIGKGNKKYQIPKLSEVLNLVSENNKILNIEIKQQGITKLILSEINKSKINQENIIISSFKHKELEEVRAQNKDMKIAILFGSEDGSSAEYFDYLTGLDKKLGGTILAPNCYSTNEKILNWSKEKYFWTIKTAEIESGLVDKLTKLEKANFITDYPEILIDYLS